MRRSRESNRRWCVTKLARVSPRKPRPCSVMRSSVPRSVVGCMPSPASHRSEFTIRCTNSPALWGCVICPTGSLWEEQVSASMFVWVPKWWSPGAFGTCRPGAWKKPATPPRGAETVGGWERERSPRQGLSTWQAAKAGVPEAEVIQKEPTRGLVEWLFF